MTKFVYHKALFVVAFFALIAFLFFTISRLVISSVNSSHNEFINNEYSGRISSIRNIRRGMYSLGVEMSDTFLSLDLPLAVFLREHPLHVGDSIRKEKGSEEVFFFAQSDSTSEPIRFTLGKPRF